MDLKRILTTVLGLPIVALLFVLGNKYVIGVAVLIVSIISMHEYFGAIKKVANPIKWVGYLSNIFIIGAILGFAMGYTKNILEDTYYFSFAVAVAWWGVSFIGGMFMLGFAEIIKLLNAIKNK